MTGITWTTPVGPWIALVAAILFGIAAVRLVRLAWTYLRVITNKPNTVVEVESSGTSKPILEIAHFGAPLTFSAEGRIVKTLNPDAVTQPSRSRFACQLHPPEGRDAGQHITLRDSEWAHIVLADIVLRKPDDSSWLRIRRGSFHRGALAEDTGVDVEIVIKTQPSWPVGTIKRVIRVTRNGECITAVPVDD